jgi:uncharacterized damage-inducible protein DinB
MNGNEIARLFSFAEMTVSQNARDVTHAESLVAPAAGGNPMNWILGHILCTRSHMFAMMGEPSFWTDEERAAYERGSRQLESDDAAPFERLVETYTRTTAEVRGFLEGKAEAELDRAVPQGTPEFLGGTIGEALVAFAWHEGYHAGQLGVVRRTLGKPGAIR